jgi:ribosomal protein S18 acetylase RimI-like enzyme
MKSSFYIKLPDGRIAVADLIHITNNHYVISRINVPIAWRGLGYGRKLLQQIIEEADAENTILTLGVYDSGGLTKRQLIAWYKRYGFKKSKTSYSRKPKGKVQ